MTQEADSLKLPPINKREHSSSSESSPFQIPNDNEVFTVTDPESATQGKNAKIWDKTTASCRNPLKRFDKFQTPVDDKYVPMNVYNPKQRKLIEDALQLIDNRRKNKDLAPKKQIIVDILQQKKEMFLVTMTHGIIEKEIGNLIKQAGDRKKALEDSEKLLEKDKEEFEKFQDSYKQETKKAEQLYEKQVQERKNKEQLIKTQQINVNSLRGEKTRNEENVTVYLKYKKFLDLLLPKQWVEERTAIKNKKIDAIKQKYFDMWLEADFKDDEELKRNRSKLLTTKQKDYEKKFETMLINEEIEEVDKIENEEEMYFKQPEQLIELFNGIEEASLFCIQNTREASQAYLSLKTAFEDKKMKLEAKHKSLLEQKSSLEKQLNEIEGSIRMLKKKKEQNINSTNEKDNKDIKTIIENEYMNMKEMMPNFMPQVEINSSSALTLLSCIEICMERLLEKLLEASMEHPKVIKDIRVSLDKEKNMKKREEVSNFNREEDQKRKSRNQNKKEPVDRVVGRVDMMRSAPRDREKTKKVVVQENPFDQNKKYLME